MGEKEQYEMSEPRLHKNIATALAGAQAEMGKALKSTPNPHFKSKYADLSSVVDACMPALNSHGIAVIQPTGEDDTGRFVRTVLIHGASGETLECRVPLIVGKNDMQGYGSAVTYARRYGLMGMAGIAPEDDDGNSAAKNAPKTVTPDQFVNLRNRAVEAGVPEHKVCLTYQAPSFQQFPSEHYDTAMKKLAKTIEGQSSKEDDLSGDHIPEYGDDK